MAKFAARNENSLFTLTGTNQLLDKMDATTLAILAGSVLLILSIVLSKASFKIGVPALLIFLGIGMLAGEDGFGLQFDNAELAQGFGTLALNIILFSGGLDTNINSVKPVLWKGVSLATVGVFLTAMIVGLFVYWITDFTLLESLLLGSVVSSTDAAAVFSIFRTQKVGLKRRLKDVIELESASNDPMAYMLTITMISLIQTDGMSAWSVIPLFLIQIVVGVLCGVALGYLSVKFLNMVKLDVAGLYPVLVIGLNLFIYSFTSYLSGNGFLAIYIAAVIMGNSNFVHKRTMIMFYDGFAWLMQIVMFLLLGLLVTPSEMLQYLWVGLAISAFMILAARPMAVLLSLLPFRKMRYKDKMFVSWCGLRGAVPIVFATYPLLAGIESAEAIFNIVFYITLTSMLLQGTTFSRVAKLMGLTRRDTSGETFVFNDQDDFNSELREIVIANPECSEKPIMELGLPEGALVVYIKRDKQYITPKGATRVRLGDKLLVMANEQSTIREVRSLLGQPEFSLIEDDNDKDDKA